MLTSGIFWRATAERAAKTFAQALVALFVAGVTILTVSWLDALAVAATAALVSVLTSIASAGVSSYGPSLGPEVIAAPTPAPVPIPEDVEP